MKNKNYLWGSIKRILTFLMALAIVVSFSQPLSVQAKAKVNKVKLSKVGFTLDLDQMQNVAKPLVKGKNKVTVWYKNGTVYQGYAKFTAPATKTYTLKFSNLVAKNGKKNLVLGHVTGSFVDGHTETDAKIGSSKDSYKVKLGSNMVSPFKKTYTSKVALEEGQTIYLYYQFSSHSKTKNVSLNVTIK